MKFRASKICGAKSCARSAVCEYQQGEFKLAHKLSITWFLLLKKIKRKCYAKYVISCMFTFGMQITVKCCKLLLRQQIALLCLFQTQSTQHWSAVIKLWNIHTTNTVTYSYSSAHVITALLVKHGNSQFIIPVKVIRTLRCYEDWRKAAVRQNWHTNGACERVLPTDSTDTSQWKCHNCICGKRAVEKLTQYPTRIENIPANCLRSTSWQSVASIPLLEETIYQTATSWAHCDSFLTQSFVDERSVF